ncbi:MAG: carbohydrate ABC transporter permease [Propionibacteriaceae bacterium]|jgi:cellobiose transport system permease protein|nr:carbohydrate ABC transporter permease [Propionibacteriaceae bacterium]
MSRSTPSVTAVSQIAGKGAAKAAARQLKRGKRGTKFSSEGRRAGWVTYAVLGATLLFFAYPLYYTVQLASISKDEMYDFHGLAIGAQLLENLGKAFQGLNFWAALGNTLIVSGVCALSVVFFSTLAGYSFAKLRFRGRGPLMVFVVGTMAIPAQLSAVPLFIVMKNLGLVGSLTGVIIPGLVTAFGVFWMTQYLQAALPYELIEAARVDGCSMIKTFYHVALPAARPAAAMLALFTFVAQWTNYYWPFVIIANNAKKVPLLTLAAATLSGGNAQNYPLAMAGVALTSFPLVLLFFFAGKQLVSGIMAGAVKG